MRAVNVNNRFSLPQIDAVGMTVINISNTHQGQKSASKTSCNPTRSPFVDSVNVLGRSAVKRRIIPVVNDGAFLKGKILATETKCSQNPQLIR